MHGSRVPYGGHPLEHQVVEYAMATPQLRRKVRFSKQALEIERKRDRVGTSLNQFDRRKPWLKWEQKPPDSPDRIHSDENKAIELAKALFHEVYPNATFEYWGPQLDADGNIVRDYTQSAEPCDCTNKTTDSFNAANSASD